VLYRARAHLEKFHDAIDALTFIQLYFIIISSKSHVTPLMIQLFNGILRKNGGQANVNKL